jgi:hypothetical protein
MTSDESPNYEPGFDELVPLSDAADISGLSPDHLRRLVRNGDLWGMKIGRNWVTTKKAIEEYLAQDRKPGPKPKPSE